MRRAARTANRFLTLSRLNNPGSLAIFAVIRRASSGVSNLAGAKTQKSNRGGPPLFRQGLNSAFKFRS
jgi:hypothetical protein